MSGSRRWFQYTDDQGRDFAVELDESNSESNLDGIRLMGDIDGSEILLPGRLNMRYVNTISRDNALIRRKFFVGVVALFNSIESADSISDDGVIYKILSRRGERAAFPNPVDTAQIDGDSPN
jgi:hypothetical protein